MSNNENFFKYFSDVLNRLNITKSYEDSEKLLLCKSFIQRLKKNKESLKNFKNRDNIFLNEVKYFNDDNDNLLKEKLKNDDDLWTELQLTILLYEINNKGSNKLIKKLYKKIKTHNKNKLFEDDINNTNKFVNNEFNIPNIGNINLDSVKNLFGENDEDKNKKTKDLIDNIFSDIKNKLDNKDNINTSDIFSISKELSDNYKNKFNSENVSISSVLCGLVDIVKNPDDIANKFKGVDKKFNTNDVFSDVKNNIFGGKNPLELLNGNNTEAGTNNLSITNETIDSIEKEKEVEDYYNNVKL